MTTLLYKYFNTRLVVPKHMNGFLLTRDLLLIPILSIYTAKFEVSIKEKQDRFPTLYWLPKLHNHSRPYKARFIANPSSCTTTVLSKLLTSCLTAVEKHWIRYYDTVWAELTIFWPIKNSNDVLQ